MDFTKGYTASFYAAFVDPDSWLDGDRLDIVSGSINRTATGLRSTADIVVREYDEPTDRYIRVYMDCEQDGDKAHVPLFTGIVSTPGENVQGPVRDVQLQAYSPLKAAEDIKLQLGDYVPAGTNGAEAIRKLLKSQKAPVEINGIAPALEEHIIAEQNENCVTFAEKILEAINWKLQIAGDGSIRLSPKEEDPEEALTISADENDIMEQDPHRGRDWFNCPNVLRVTSGEQTWTARDDDPNSELSTVARGREVQAVEDNVTLADDEGLIQYANRRLKELQQITETASYTRRFMPDLNIGDAIRISYTQLEGKYVIEGQTISLTPGGQTSENVSRIAEPEKITTIGYGTGWGLIKLPDGYYFVFPDGNRVLAPYIVTIIS